MKYKMSEIGQWKSNFIKSGIIFLIWMLGTSIFKKTDIELENILTLIIGPGSLVTCLFSFFKWKHASGTMNQQYGFSLIFIALAMPLASKISGFTFLYANTMSLIIAISGVLSVGLSKKQSK